MLLSNFTLAQPGPPEDDVVDVPIDGGATFLAVAIGAAATKYLSKKKSGPIE
jgi:hypothetical protein